MMQNKSIEELLNRQSEINNTLGGYENRELNADEKKEYDTLVREFETNKREISLRQQMAVNAPKAETFGDKMVREIRESVKNRQSREISLSILSSGDTNNIVSAGAQKTTIYDILPNLEKGLIWGQMGMKMQSGVRGNLVWPYATTNVEVDEVAEAATLNDKDINFANKTAVPYSSGITIKVTNEAIDESSFDLQGFVQTQMGLAVLRYLNKKTFSPANWSGLAGPFKNATASDIDCTYANIKAKKALIAAAGVDMSGFAYVCDNKTKALLESTPKANGQGGFICENGKIDGDPVYVTEYINTKADGSQETTKYYLEMGCWNYLAACQHDEVRFTVDPITLASYNETKFVLNTRYSLTNLATATAFAIYNLVDVSANPVEVKVVNTDSAPVKTKEVSD